MAALEDKKFLSLTVAGGLFALNSAIIGSMMPAFGTEGLWFLAANTAMAGGILALGYLKRVAKLIAAGGVLIAAWCAYQGWLEYSGANYHLAYRVCGALTQEDDGDGAFFFGVNYINNNAFDLHLRDDSRILQFDGLASKAPLATQEMTISPWKASDAQVPARDDLVGGLSFLIPTNRYLQGRVRYTYFYGRDRTKLQKPLIINGVITVYFDENGYPRPMVFTPQGDSTDYDPTPCDPRSYEGPLTPFSSI